MSSDRAPPERPEPADELSDDPSGDDEIDASPAQRRESLSEVITMEPGRRKTGNVELLEIEAELVADGHEPDNPAIPVDTDTGEAFRERIEDTDLVPAWTRPWEVTDDE